MALVSFKLELSSGGIQGHWHRGNPVVSVPMSFDLPGGILVGKIQVPQMAARIPVSDDRNKGGAYTPLRSTST